MRFVIFVLFAMASVPATAAPWDGFSSSHMLGPESRLNAPAPRSGTVTTRKITVDRRTGRVIKSEVIARERVEDIRPLCDRPAANTFCH